MTEQLQAKVSLKVGDVELQYEGNENFLAKELPKLFQELLEIHKSSLSNEESTNTFEEIETSQALTSTVIGTNNEKIDLGVNEIADKIGIKRGSDLVIAACAYLAVVCQKATFSRSEILDAMESANHYYTGNHTKSLSRYIESLVNKGYLLERGKDTYAIERMQFLNLQSALAL